MIISIPLKSVSLNKLLRMHWEDERKLKKIWKGYLLLSHRSVKPYVPFTSVEIIMHRKRLLDKDNAYGSAKMILDSIKDLGWIKDDSFKSINYKVTQIEDKKEFTEIKLGHGEIKNDFRNIAKT